MFFKRYGIIFALLTLVLFSSCDSPGSVDPNNDISYRALKSNVAVGKGFIAYSAPGGIFIVNGNGKPKKICSKTADHGLEIFGDLIYTNSFRLKTDGSEFTEFDRDYPVFDGKYFYYTEFDNKTYKGKLFQREGLDGKPRQLWKGRLFANSYKHRIAESGEWGMYDDDDLSVICVNNSKVIIAELDDQSCYTDYHKYYEIDKTTAEVLESYYDDYHDDDNGYPNWLCDARQQSVYDGFCYYMDKDGEGGIYKCAANDFFNAEKLSDDEPYRVFFSKGSLFYDEYNPDTKSTEIIALDIKSKKASVIYSEKSRSGSLNENSHYLDVLAVSDNRIIFTVAIDSSVGDCGRSIELWRINKDGTKPERLMQYDVAETDDLFDDYY